MEQKTVLIMPNLSKYNTVWLMKAIIGQLRAAGCVPVMDERFRGQFGEVGYGAFDRQIAACDVVVTVGGDGTILHAAKHAVEYQKPILRDQHGQARIPRAGGAQRAGIPRAAFERGLHDPGQDAARGWRSTGVPACATPSTTS